MKSPNPLMGEALSTGVFCSEVNYAYGFNKKNPIDIVGWGIFYRCQGCWAD